MQGAPEGRGEARFAGFLLVSAGFSPGKTSLWVRRTSRLNQRERRFIQRRESVSNFGYTLSVSLNATETVYFGQRIKERKAQKQSHTSITWPRHRFKRFPDARFGSSQNEKVSSYVGDAILFSLSPASFIVSIISRPRTFPFAASPPLSTHVLLITLHLFSATFPFLVLPTFLCVRVLCVRSPARPLPPPP